MSRAWRSDRSDFGNHGQRGGTGGPRNDSRPEVMPGQEFAVTIQQIDDGLVVGKVAAADDVGVAGYRLLGNLDADRDGVPAFSIASDGTITITDIDDVFFDSNETIDLSVVAIDTAGQVSFREAVSVALTSDPLIPTDTPFGYYIGINYESWDAGRIGYSIPADLDQITQYFNLIRTYHDAGVGTSDPTNPTIDTTQAQVIDYVVATDNLQLVMGTNNNALAQGGGGVAWTAGLMVDPAYTDAWVQMLIDAFGSVAEVQAHLTAILLGNEIDSNGPPPTDPSFADYLTWIQTSFTNLQTSLSNAGLGAIPISTTIANYGSTNLVSVQITQFINDNWGADWNSGTPFVMFNQYTPDGMTSTDFSAVESYFEWVQTQVPAGLEVFIGETGYSTTSGTANPAQDQATVFTEIFAWLDSMDGTPANGGGMVPMFPFIAFDRPTAWPAIEVGFGIFGQDSNYQPTGLKPGLDGIVPGWTTDPVTALMLDGDALAGTADQDIFDVAGGHGAIDGGDGNFDLLVLDGDRDEFDFSALGAGRGRHASPSDAVRIESKADGDTSIDLKNVEYVQFDDGLVKVGDLVQSQGGYHGNHGHRGHHHWDHFDLG